MSHYDNLRDYPSIPLKAEFLDLFGRPLKIGDVVADLASGRSGLYCQINEILDFKGNKIILKGTYKIPKNGIANLLVVDKSTLPANLKSDISQ